MSDISDGRTTVGNVPAAAHREQSLSYLSLQEGILAVDAILAGPLVGTDVAARPRRYFLDNSSQRRMLVFGDVGQRPGGVLFRGWREGRYELATGFGESDPHAAPSSGEATPTDKFSSA